MAAYIIFEGFRMDARTRDMLTELRRICKAPVRITQGGFNKGGVPASAGTHDGGGALDIRAQGLTSAQIAEIVLRARQVGFAAWLRLPSQGNWPLHIHMVAVGCSTLSAGAARQVTAYRKGRNGLANNGPDSGPRTYAGNTWESYKASLKPAGPRVSLGSIAYAANGAGYFNSGQAVALASARAFYAWIKAIGVISQHNYDVWDRAIRARNWAGAQGEYRAGVKRFQSRYGLFVDGVVGPKTKAKISALMKQYGYRVVA